MQLIKHDFETKHEIDSFPTSFLLETAHDRQYAFAETLVLNSSGGTTKKSYAETTWLNSMFASFTKIISALWCLNQNINFFVAILLTSIP